MNTIKESEVEEEKKFLEDWVADKKSIRKPEQRFLESRGYELRELGTDATSEIRSRQIAIMKKIGEEERYLAVGIYAESVTAFSDGWKYKIYRAYVKQII